MPWKGAIHHIIPAKTRVQESENLRNQAAARLSRKFAKARLPS
jgi:hypothetical protein